jgi:DNA-binding transcriptional ArsR family regulator
MAPDLLSTIRSEIDERLTGLRPLLSEYERLLAVVDALQAAGREGGLPAAMKTASPMKHSRGRGQSDATAPTTVSSSLDGRLDAELVKLPQAAEARRGAPSQPAAAKSRPARALRGAAREAILAALEHGSHTVGELAMVTAMSGPTINGSLRRLAFEGAIVKTERKGKTAWLLPDSNM